MVVDTADTRSTTPSPARARRRSEADASELAADSPVAAMLAGAIRPSQRERDVVVKSSPKGLWIDPRTPYGWWKAIGVRLALRAEATTWWLGDWLAFGQRCYGRRYKDAVEATGLDYQTLRNYAAVARRFPLSRRRDNLSFQHHAELCALPEAAQDRWLDLAAENHWSKRELRLRVRAARSVDDARSELHVLRVAVERGHAQSWREAAERCHCRYGDWVVNALNAAAAGSVTSSVER